MCELLGVSINRPERPMYAFRGLEHGSKEDSDWRKSNPHGWGVACYPEDGPAALILKEAAPAHSSPLAAIVRDGLLPRSRTHLLHIRRKSTDGPEAVFANTHPFSRVVEGCEYVFAHNGGLREFKHTLALGPHSCLGETTSEYAFCHLLAVAGEAIRARQWENVLPVLHGINKFGHFNCIFSDGGVLAAYRDREGYKNLCVLERHAPSKEITLDGDDDFRVDLCLSADESRSACLIATRPLTHGEDWQPLPKGGLLIAEAGEVIAIFHEDAVS